MPPAPSTATTQAVPTPIAMVNPGIGTGVPQNTEGTGGSTRMDPSHPCCCSAPNNVLSWPLNWDRHPRSPGVGYGAGKRTGSTLPCPLHATLLLTSSCIIFLLGPNPSHRSRSWVSSGTKGKASKNCRYTCTKVRTRTARCAKSRAPVLHLLAQQGSGTGWQGRTNPSWVPVTGQHRPLQNPEVTHLPQVNAGAQKQLSRAVGEGQVLHQEAPQLTLVFGCPCQCEAGSCKETTWEVRIATSIRETAWPQSWPCPMQQCRTVAGHCHTPSLCWVLCKLALSVSARTGSRSRQSTTHLLGC